MFIEPIIIVTPVQKPATLTAPLLLTWHPTPHQHEPVVLIVGRTPLPTYRQPLNLFMTNPPQPGPWSPCVGGWSPTPTLLLLTWDSPAATQHEMASAAKSTEVRWSCCLPFEIKW